RKIQADIHIVLTTQWPCLSTPPHRRGSGKCSKPPLHSDGHLKRSALLHLQSSQKYPAAPIRRTPSEILRHSGQGLSAYRLSNNFVYANKGGKSVAENQMAFVTVAALPDFRFWHL